MAADRFQHSLKTISRHFKVVMHALCRLGKTLMTPQPINGVHPHVRYNRKYYPWFEVTQSTIILYRIKCNSYGCLLCKHHRI